jgi:hypothetical protein
LRTESVSIRTNGHDDWTIAHVGGRAGVLATLYPSHTDQCVRACQGVSGSVTVAPSNLPIRVGVGIRRHPSASSFDLWHHHPNPLGNATPPLSYRLGMSISENNSFLHPVLVLGVGAGGLRNGRRNCARFLSAHSLCLARRASAMSATGAPPGAASSAPAASCMTRAAARSPCSASS